MKKKIDRFDREYAWLSNFYPASLEIDGLRYLSSEGAYQAAKCANPRERLLFTEQPPNAAKSMGSSVEIRPDWDAVKIKEMERIVRAKFTQNPYLARYLLDTGDAELIEGNTWHDIFWGVDLNTGEGQNHLGKLLMALREDFRENGPPSMESQLPYWETRAADGLCVQFRDLPQADCDAIVHVTNENLLYGYDALDYAVYLAAGPELRKACEKLGGCSVAQAKLTDGFQLKARYVIHTVGPCYGVENGDALLAKTYEAILELAAENGLGSIAVPAISVGKNGYPKEKGTELAVRAVRRWKAAHPEAALSVVFVCTDFNVYAGFCKALRAAND